MFPAGRFPGISRYAYLLMLCKPPPSERQIKGKGSPDIKCASSVSSWSEEALCYLGTLCRLSLPDAEAEQRARQYWNG